MATLANLKSRIANELNRDDMTDNISLAVQDAILYFNKENWEFNDSTTVIQTAPDTREYTLPADFLEMIHVKVHRSGNFYSIDPEEFGKLEHLHFSENYQNFPEIYAIFGNKLFLYPEPDETNSLTIHYKSQINTTTDAASTVWTNGLGEQIIRYRAEEHIYNFVIRGDDAARMAQYCNIKVLETWTQMKKQYEKKTNQRIRRRGLL